RLGIAPVVLDLGGAWATALGVRRVKGPIAPVNIVLGYPRLEVGPPRAAASLSWRVQAEIGQRVGVLAAFADPERGNLLAENVSSGLVHLLEIGGPGLALGVPAPGI